jgi:RNA polymerase sigma-70 factor (ECF subfamily)
MALLNEDERDVDFARLFSEHRRALLRYVLRHLNDYASCEDVVVETFEVAWRRWGELPPRDRELPWLYAIALRLLSNNQRSRDRRWKLLTRLARERSEGIEDENSDRVFRDLLIEPLAALRADERELLEFVYWEELSYRDIAEILVTVQVPSWRGSTSFGRSGLIVESSLVMALRTALTSPHPKRCSLS